MFPRPKVKVLPNKLNFHPSSPIKVFYHPHMSQDLGYVEQHLQDQQSLTNNFQKNVKVFQSHFCVPFCRLQEIFLHSKLFTKSERI